MEYFGSKPLQWNTLGLKYPGDAQSHLVIRVLDNANRYPWSMTFDWTTGPLAEGLRLYNTGEYFSAHESWETVWLTAVEPERTFLQGLIQVTAAFEHLKRNNNQLGASRLLTHALRRLAPYSAGFGNIDVDLLRADLRDRLASLATGTSPAPARILPL